MAVVHLHLRRLIKRIIDGGCRALVFPCALMCRPGPNGARNRKAFEFWAHVFAAVPGLPGGFLRRAFYRWTLRRSAPSFYVGFGAFFSHPSSEIEQDVYIGPYAIVGGARLGRGCLIGSRASIVSGARLHQVNAAGEWMPSDESRLEELEIGAHAWIGEAAVIMADVGSGAMVAAGAVASNRVPSRVLVAGNPARFVRHITPPAPTTEVASGAL
jgi:acetyltransferase-like isoleucine patch superfamily enzyme